VPRRSAKRAGQGTPPAVAMLWCVLFVLLAGAGLWYADRLLQNAAPVAAPPPPPPAAPAADDKQAAIVKDEDARIEATVFGRPLPGAPHEPATVTLVARPQRYVLADLIGMGVAVRVNPTTVDLVRSVVVLPGAILDVEAPGTTLRMASTPAGFTSIVGWRGAVTMAGAADKPLTIISWDQGAKGPDRVLGDGRAYIRDVGAALTLRFVHAGTLGFWSGRTGGIALTGLQESAATGAISDSEISDNHYGLFTSDVNKLTVTATTFRRSELEGVLLHRGTANVVLERSTAEANGAEGFVADRGSEAITLRQVSAVGNAGDGIRFNGAPIAEDAGPAGASNVPHRNFHLENSLVRDNRGDGVQATDTDQLVIAGNQLIGHDDGIVVTGRSPGAQITNNTVRGALSAAIAVRGGPSGAVVKGNRIDGAETGLQVRDAQADLRDNVVTGATSHGLSVVGAADRSTVEGNSLAGAGASALDVARVAPPAVVTVGPNNIDGWHVQVSPSEYVSNLIRDHPLLPLWALVLLAPLALVLVRRRLGSRPYVEGGGVVEAPATAQDVRGETMLIPLSGVREHARASAPPVPSPTPGPVPAPQLAVWPAPAHESMPGPMPRPMPTPRPASPAGRATPALRNHGAAPRKGQGL
jgi:Right handed beta helix region